MSTDKTPARLGMHFNPGMRAMMVELVGGPRDGEKFVIHNGVQELRCPYVATAPSFVVDAGEDPIMPTLKTGRYTWHTEADYLLGRWTWSETL